MRDNRKPKYMSPKLGSIKVHVFFALQQQFGDTADPQVEFEAYKRNCFVSSISPVESVGAIRFASIANLELLNVGTFRLTSMQAPVYR